MVEELEGDMRVKQSFCAFHYLVFTLTFNFLIFWLCCVQHTGSQFPPGDRTHVPCMEAWSPNHRTTREVPMTVVFNGRYYTMSLR